MSEAEESVASYLATNDTDHGEFSPIMLYNGIPQVTRLVFMTISAFVGCTVNGVFTNSFSVECEFRKVGKIYLLCIGLTDLMITMVMGISAMVLLSGEWDTVSLCRGLHILVEAGIYFINIFFMLIALENIQWVAGSKIEYDVFITSRLCCKPLLVFIIFSALSIVGVVYHLDYDYCERKYFGNFTYRLSTGFIFYCLPGIATVSFCLASLVFIDHEARLDIQFRRSLLYHRMRSSVKLTLISYCTFVLVWLPHLYVVFRSASEKEYYFTLWFALYRSVYASLIYIVGDKGFRRSFVMLFNYCFCKKPLPVPHVRRRRRTFQNRRENANELRLFAIREGTAPLAALPNDEIQETQNL